MEERIQYGPGKDQWGDLYLPEGAARGVVVVIHGGFWRELRTAEITVPESEDLAARGFAVFNLEYRRVGGAEGAGAGGGWPATGEDIVAGIRALHGTSVSGLPVVLLGHSAGGQLAAWAAGHVEVAGVVSQAGVLALTESARLGIGDGAAVNFLGATPEETPALYDQADPLKNVPLRVPLVALHSGLDKVVPSALSELYVKAATAAGADARLIQVEGDHVDPIRPGSQAYQVGIDAINFILGR
ncbi:alpha/beta hydrolase [Arthrobacter sp.]|uniref:alpha/beta hydrolase family protein n=1 Tax=Arthrobacter sp. TaxID=1667 RepID=UPI002588A3EF|nr:alpha/beta hydrolase [Arthrobacter sp.]